MEAEKDGFEFQEFPFFVSSISLVKWVAVWLFQVIGIMRDIDDQGIFCNNLRFCTSHMIMRVRFIGKGWVPIARDFMGARGSCATQSTSSSQPAATT